MTATKENNLSRIYEQNSYKLGFAMALFVFISLAIFRFFLIFTYNGEIGGIDNNFVFDVVRNLNGDPIYTNPAQAPYSITLYPPLYYIVCSFIGNLFNVDPSEPINVYMLCRSVSLICDIITCLYLYIIVKKNVGLPRELAALIVAVFACILCWLGYTFSRCDSMLLTCYAALIYLLFRYHNRFTFSRIIILAILSVACILSKQNGIICPVVIGIWLYHAGSKRLLIYFSAAVAFLLTLTLLACHYFYPYFFDNTVTALNNKIDWPWFYVYIFKRTMDSPWMIVLYITFILSVKNLFAPVKSIDNTLYIIFLTQFLFSFATTLKWGSTLGYFNESFFLASIILARKIVPYNQNNPAIVKKWVAVSLPLITLFSIHTLLQGYLFFIQRQPEKKAAYIQQKEISKLLKSKVGGGLIMNIANPNTDFFKSLLSKEIAVPNIDMVECCTFPDKNFDYSLLKKDLSNGKIRYLIANNGDQPSDIWGISLPDFVKDTSISRYTIYVFKPADNKK